LSFLTNFTFIAKERHHPAAWLLVCGACVCACACAFACACV